jgi:lipoate---protein ligase
MKYIELSLPTPEENLAADEVLLDCCEQEGEEILRFWESGQYFAVLGYSNKIQQEVNESACSRCGIPILRRSSGGGTVLQGPGCLNYSLILKINGPALKSISGTNRYVMEKNKLALGTLTREPLRTEGFTDLTVRNLKFSGNAQRRKLKTVLFHGTFLYNFDLSLIEIYLKHPPRQPAYRKNRPHSDFLTNLDVAPESIKTSLRDAWKAVEKSRAVPAEIIGRLVREKYSRRQWNAEF